MVLQGRSKGQEFFTSPRWSSWFEDHTMRIPHTHAGERQISLGHYNWLLNQLWHIERAGKGRWVKDGLAHLNGCGAGVAMAIHMEGDRDESTLCVHREVLLLRLAGCMEIAGKNTKSVS